MDQVKSVITLRSGKVIEKPTLEPCEKDESPRVRKGLNLNIAKKRLISH
jgi:arginyl-tRNA--protein-N-Asp/Glu arginylyltransferase